MAAGYDFKKEEDVKLYLQNLGIEYRFECYHERKADGCHRLGDYMDAIKNDFSKAGLLYKKNCDERQFARSCYTFATYSYQGKGCKKDAELALSYYKKGCDYGCQEACFHAGLLSASPQKKEYASAMKYLDQSCTMKNDTSCLFASSLINSGVDEMCKDAVRAFEYAIKACDLRNIKGCRTVARMYKKGLGVEENLEKSKLFQEKANQMRTDLAEGHNLEFGRLS